MAARNEPSNSLITRANQWIWGAPSIICKWTTMDREYEVRIVKQGRYVTAELFDTRANEVRHSYNTGWWSPMSGIQKCIQRWRNQITEIRLFRNSDPTRLDAVVVDFRTKRLGVFTWKGQSESEIGELQTNLNPVIENSYMGTPQAIQFGINILSENPDQRWLMDKDESDVGITRIGNDGREEELVHIVPQQGFDGAEDIQIIRKKTRDRHSLVCEIFNRTTKNAMPLPCSNLEFRFTAGHLNPSTNEIAYYRGCPIANLTYDRNKKPILVNFEGEPPNRILFAEDQSLGALSLTEVGKIATRYFTTYDEWGNEVQCYDEGTLTVTKEMANRFSDHTKPVIFIEFRRNTVVRCLKPIWSFFQALWGTDHYRGSVNTTAMEDLILRNSALTEEDRNIGRQSVEKAFARCAIVRIAIACDRSDGRLTCDDNTYTLWTARGGNWSHDQLRNLSRWATGNHIQPTPQMEMPHLRIGSSAVNEANRRPQIRRMPSLSRLQGGSPALHPQLQIPGFGLGPSSALSRDGRFRGGVRYRPPNNYSE